MNKNLNKLVEAYNYLRSIGRVHTQKDLATAIDCNEAVLSSAFNNDKKYLTKGLLRKLCLAYSDIFNIEYFIKDEGEMLKSVVNQNNVSGDNIQGHNVTVNKSQTDKFLDLLQTKDEQMNRLIGIIEKLNNI